MQSLAIKTRAFIHRLSALSRRAERVRAAARRVTTEAPVGVSQKWTSTAEGNSRHSNGDSPLLQTWDLIS
mgnify:CR=1 FL=1